MRRRDESQLQDVQPKASELVSHQNLASQLDELGNEPRVHVTRVGTSHGGREIFLASISSPEHIRDLGNIRQRALEATTYRGQWEGPGEALRAHPGPIGAADWIPAVLIIGLSFGHEAAHVEALLQLARHLARSLDDEVQDILSKLVVLVIPMVNPDGRMLALEEWQRTPLSAGCGGAGNAFGFLLNRDFLHLTQPETQAVTRVFSEWQPIVCIDLHEDKVFLKVTRPEVCWCPPYADKPYPETLRPQIMEIVDELGAAIAKEWTEDGFHVLFDPEGTEALLPIARKPAGRADQTYAYHNTIALITESARTPGSQTWADRVTQKFSACMVVLRHIAANRARYAQVVTWARTTVPPRTSYPTYVVPIGKGDAAGLYRLLVTLDRNGVECYRVETPYPAYVVPTAQPRIEIVRSLFGDTGRENQILLSDFGVPGFVLERLPQQVRDAFRKSPLSRVVGVPLPQAELTSDKKRGPDTYCFDDSLWGIALANRLLKQGTAVSRLTVEATHGDKRFPPGTFLAHGIPFESLRAAGRDLGVSASAVTIPHCSGQVSITSPRVALYVGQGVDMQHSVHRADLAWGLKQMEIPYEEVREEEIVTGRLAASEVLIVPAGDPSEILHGHDPRGVWNSHPWQPSTSRRGLGEGGAARILSFVKNGGIYVGIGAGGGAFASADFSGLMDFRLEQPIPRPGEVLLRLEVPDHPVLWGYRGCHNDVGEWLEGLVPAFYYGEKLHGTPAAPMMRIGPDAVALATYQRMVPAPEFLVRDQGADVSSYQGKPAIVFQQIGQGAAVVFGVNVGFRGIWTSTLRLLANAAYLRSALQSPVIHP